MKLPQYWPLLLIKITAWLVILNIFCKRTLYWFFSDSTFPRLDLELVTYLFVASLYFTLIFAIMVRMTQNIMHLPTNPSFRKKRNQFAFVFLDLLFFFAIFSTISHIPSINFFLVVFYLGNAFLLTIQHQKYETQKSRIAVTYSATKIPFSPLRIIVLVIYVVLNMLIAFIDTYSPLFYMGPIVTGMFAHFLLKPLYPPARWIVRFGRMLLTIIIGFTLLFATGLVRFVLYDRPNSVFNSIIYPRVIVFGLLNCAIVFFFTQANRIQLTPMHAKDPLHEPWTQGQPSSHSSTFVASDAFVSPPSGPDQCPHCHSPLDPSVLTNLISNVIIYCPYCGQQLFRGDFQSITKEELLTEHQRVMGQLMHD